MPTKRKLQDELKEGETVDTQAVAKEIDEEISERNAELAKPAKAARYIVVKDFEIDGEEYKAGEEFVPRKTWERDLTFEEFRSAERKNRNVELVGVAFLIPGKVLNKAGEREVLRQVLPIKEA